MLTGGIFLAVALPLFWFYDSGIAVSPLVVAMLVGAYALAYNVEFEVGPGLAPATQLVFVPLLFLLPLELVPLCVAAGVMLGNVLELVEGRIRLERVLGRLGEACYSLGPVLVLVAAGAPAPGDAGDTRAARGARRPVRRRLCDRDDARADRARNLAPPLHPRPRRRVGGGCDPRPDRAARPRSRPSIMLPPSCSCSRSSVSCARLRASGAAVSITLSSSAMRIAAPRSCSGTSSRQTMRTRARTAAMSSRSRSPSPSSSGSTHAAAATRSSWRCCTTSARSGSRTRSSTSRGRSRPRSVRSSRRTRSSARRCSTGSAACSATSGSLVRSCHERFGGGGYPDGLVGEEIPLVARIVCCCDAYSAITTDRPYRAGRSAEEALEELRRCAGAQFDPDVVEALARVAAVPA